MGLPCYATIAADRHAHEEGRRAAREIALELATDDAYAVVWERHALDIVTDALPTLDPVKGEDEEAARLVQMLNRALDRCPSPDDHATHFARLGRLLWRVLERRADGYATKDAEAMIDG